VDELVRRGDKVQAIRRYRQLHGVDLKDAKAAVEAIERQLAGGS
jgi:ribosomal protein L7/L12